jgi:type II secretory pathway component GspD/PulD (secretin)
MRQPNPTRLTLVLLIAALVMATASPAQTTSTPKPRRAAKATPATAIPSADTVVSPAAALPPATPIVVADSLHPAELIPVSDTVKVPVLDFKNTDIRDVLRALGMQYGVNIFLEPSVTGQVSLYLSDVSVRHAIDFIAKQNGLTYTVENGIVRMAKYTAPPPPEVKPTQVFHLSDGKLDIDIRDMPVQDVARMFVDTAGMNVVVEGAGDKRLTAKLSRITTDKAVKVVFETGGYEVATSDGIHYVSQKQWGGQAGGAQGAQDATLKRLSITVDTSRNITMEIDNAGLDQAVRTIAIQCGINVIIYDQVTGSITAKLTEIPVDDVLRFLLQNTKFTFWKDRGIYFIGSREMSQQKTSVVVPLRHIMADEKQLTDMLPPHVTRNADIKYDKEHNAVVVIGSYDAIAQAQEYLEKIDKPVPQVLIEALVVDFNVTKTRKYGINLFRPGRADSLIGAARELYFPQYSAGIQNSRVQQVLNQVFGFMKRNSPVTLPANFMAQVTFLEDNGILRVNSTPQIATLNGNTASITIGQTQYYKLVKSADVSGTSTTTNRLEINEEIKSFPFNNKLEVTPWVMPDRFVTVKIRPHFEIPQRTTEPGVPPTVDTRELESTVRLRDGQTIVLGGQRSTSASQGVKGVPILSNIPILGLLFSNRTTEKTETQMMIFLTPHVHYEDEGSVDPETFFNRSLDAYGKEQRSLRDRVKVRRERRASRVPTTRLGRWFQSLRAEERSAE